ncbi:hypothetical protein TNCV_2392601 [Trichonephila clavipes]|nr:hypothetical protein TNCV_2392601 [Trichonephila clavipes]
MKAEKEHVRHCLLYEFDKKSTGATACHNIYLVYRDDAIEEITCRRWFRKFRERDRNCQDQTKSGWPSRIGEDVIDLAIKKQPEPNHARVSGDFQRTPDNGSEMTD